MFQNLSEVENDEDDYQPLIQLPKASSSKREYNQQHNDVIFELEFKIKEYQT